MTLSEQDEQEDARVDANADAVDSPTASPVAPNAATDKPKIFGFVNGGSPGWWNVSAITEDGLCISGHCCSHPSWGPHDIGATSDWHHDVYRQYYPDGFTVEWVADVKAHDGIQRAFALNRAMTEDEHTARCAAARLPAVREAQADASDSVVNDGETQELSGV